jgi:hypothetical protein
MLLSQTRMFLRSPREYWVAVYAYSETLVEYFDPLAELPNHQIGKFISNFQTIVKNEYIFQNPLTNVCGQFCIYFVIKCCCGISVLLIF